MKVNAKYIAGAAVSAVALLAGAAQATEGGASIYPNGVETFLVGALPPPGFHFVNSTNYYHATRVNDGDGDKAMPHFRLNVVADSLKFVHVSETKLLGANVASQVIIPIVDMDVNVNGAKDDKTGLGDITVTPLILGWHFDKMHYVAALDFNVPTGRYSKTDIANLGVNYFQLEPVFAVTYLDPKGLEVSAKFMYDFNDTNDATDYSSGNEFHMDFVAGWHVDNWVAGVSGYYYKQTTDDKVHGVSVGTDGNRGEAFAVGPSVNYNFGKVMLWASWQSELYTENRAEGDKFWLRLALPL